MSGYFSGLLIIFCFNLIGASAAYLSLLAGQLTLATAAFMGVGAYATAYMCNTWNLPVAADILAGGLAATALGALASFLTLRVRGIYFALSTFALGEIIPAVFLDMDSVGGASGYPLPAYISPAVVYAASAAVLAVIVYLGCTRFTLYLTAIRTDPLVTSLMGVPTRGLSIVAFIMGAAIAGLGGGLYAASYSFVEAQHFSIMLSIYYVLMVLLGGIETPFAPVIGAAAFTFLPEIFRASEQWRYAIFAAVLIACMRLRPDGVLTAHLLSRLTRRGAQS
ncbi:branched-chain amino acid ABC transporter permease [Komagataeibacter intermedius]|uniref:Branched-chain amino acid ABC transporter permease n=3 Tax=Komagataeibacter intermedius TaxID=66229 RepID=A0A0N1N5Y9_9PROT|nr:branched-chain amino acid ABC transporter permease [Komagataeibacter intermedius]KPH86832.1 branched-chain amino acid ABC transporter permease [Komagataeibacter intermedius AF2]MCF3636865.1 branched-chain amino acid ABC transporter permease [Komagataeibacter intermedius]GAN87059.1 innermembrane translocator [Komagataeibacter intermedius TF2]GBQ71741.1 branched-chain amino acid ABC transporter permease [Komagataeibacter intermedius NRIC 0521]